LNTASFIDFCVTAGGFAVEMKLADSEDQRTQEMATVKNANATFVESVSVWQGMYSAAIASISFVMNSLPALFEAARCFFHHI
jgi:hypothetical protein